MTTAKHKVMLWSPKGAGRHYYGPGTNAYNLYRVARDGAELDIMLVHSNPDQVDDDIYDEVVQLGDRVQFNVLTLLVFLFKALAVLWRNRKHGYAFHGLDVYSPTFIPAIMAKCMGYPVALKIASYPSGLTVSDVKGLSSIRRVFARWIDRYLIISEEIRDELLQLGIADDKLAMVYNGVDVDQYGVVTDDGATICDASGSPINIEEGKRLLLFTGAICRRKRPHLLLEAVAKCASPKIWVIVLVGPLQDEEYVQEILSLSESLGLSGQLFLAGYQRNLKEYYSRADVYALPSVGEGMPNGVLEAMAAGVPIIISSFSSAKLLCNEKNGFLADDSDSIASSIDCFIRREELYESMGAESKRMVVEKYSMRAVSSNYLQCFSMITNKLSHE